MGATGGSSRSSGEFLLEANSGEVGAAFRRGEGLGYGENGERRLRGVFIGARGARRRKEQGDREGGDSSHHGYGSFL